MSVRGKQVQNGTYEFDYMRVPDTRTRWQVFRDGIYNKEDGTYCGNTPKKWGKSFRVSRVPRYESIRILTFNRTSKKEPVKNTVLF